MSVLRRARHQVGRLRGSELARNTAKLAVGQGLRLVIQAVYFVLIARGLGVKQYGAFVAMASLVAIAGPFAGLGTPMVLLKYVARDRSLLPVYWGNGLLTILVSGSLLTLAILGITPIVLGREFLLSIFLICLSDLFMIRVAELASFAFNALGQIGETARIGVYISLTRLIGIFVVSVLESHPNVKEWTVAYFFGSAVCFAYVMVRTMLVARRVQIRPTQAWKDLPEAVLFAVSVSSTSIYNDIDKTMVASLAGFSATGIYGAAYRIIDVSLVPVRAMLSAAYPQFFRLGVGGPGATKKYAYKLIKRSAPFGMLVTVSLLLGAPLIPHVLGKSYASAVEAVRWLAVIPLLRCIHIFLADGLTGAGYLGRRAAVQACVAVFNVILNLFLIRHWSWRGAAWSSIICDSVLAICLWLVLQHVVSATAEKLVEATPPKATK